MAKIGNEHADMTREESLIEMQWQAAQVATATNSTPQEKILAIMIQKIIEDIK